MAEDIDFLEEITDDSDEQLEYDLGPPGFNKSFIEIKRELLTCLNGIKITSHVAASQHYPYFINPGLMVADTLIPLPLTPRDAETIKNASRQAPFGRGDETVVDTSVRDTWELDHTQFGFANPGWSTFVELLLIDVRRSLAIPKVKAEPYKLLLYEEGSFFKRHKDSEKVPGMVATMVICLPSKHEGGSVHLSHGSKNYIFDTSKTSEYDLTTLSWFSDVTHEVKPLESGYRLVLTYNIIHVGGIRMSADLVEGQSTKLRSILTKWHSITPNGFQGMNKLIYKLEHKYTESSLSLSNLKSRDHRVCQALYELGLEYGFTVFLAQLNRTDTEEEWDEYGDGDVEIDLGYVKTCDGQEICWRMEVEEREILGKIWDREADSEDEAEFTGNAIGQALDHRPDDHRQTTSLFDLLEGVVKHSSINSKFLSDAIALAIKYKQRLLYQEVVRFAVRKPDPQQGVLKQIVESIKARSNGDAIEYPDWDYWFNDLFTEAAKQSLSTVQKTMDQIRWMLQEEDLDNKHQATPPGSMKDMFVVLLRNILVSNPPKHPVPLRGWARKPRPACRQGGAHCADCNTLRRFLEDANLEETMFRLAQYRQRHLMEQLPRQLYDCRPEKHPPKITIRKIGNEYKEEMKSYETNLKSFEDHVRTLRCDCVKSLLGEELYNELVLLKDIPDTVGSMQTRRGEKRKPEEEGDGSSASRPQLIE
ncbi:hypothetical protein ABKA04_001878 [Annulohypoxylon sp. FPYF3050]